jgi:miniconductance mechanosensitive channel
MDQPMWDGRKIAREMPPLGAAYLYATNAMLPSDTLSSELGRDLERWVDGLIGRELPSDTLAHELVLVTIALLAGALLWWGTRLFLRKVVYPIVRRSRSQWDDALVHQHFFRKLSKLAPLLLLIAVLPPVLHRHPKASELFSTLVAAAITATVMQAFFAMMNATRDVLGREERYRDKPVASYTQLAKLVAGVIGSVVLISLVFQRNPIYIFSAMGAASAVLLLIFKDSILGFVASVQLSVNDMVHVGDWVQLDKYGADGEVEEITLTTVKVHNWDQTFTTVPTYAFISDAVKNWRGMEESGGRRIKRSLFINTRSLRFCSEEDLMRYARYDLVREYVKEKQQEVTAFNDARGTDKSLPINGRNQTNIGIFRAYAVAYLQQEPRINQEMTLMVRQLDPTPQGLPLEVYCFSADKSWVNYERLASDIFDHLLSAAPWFDVEVFQAPSGSDIRALLPQGRTTT